MTWTPETCSTCRFFLLLPTPAQASAIGECRANPPVVVANGQQGVTVSKFPQIAPTDWCGGYGVRVYPI